MPFLIGPRLGGGMHTSRDRRTTDATAGCGESRPTRSRPTAAQPPAVSATGHPTTARPSTLTLHPRNSQLHPPLSTPIPKPLSSSIATRIPSDGKFYQRPSGLCSPPFFHSDLRLSRLPPPTCRRASRVAAAQAPHPVPRPLDRPTLPTRPPLQYPVPSLNL